MQKQRIWELDAIRGFCILLVIVIHFVFDLRYFASKALALPPIYLVIQDNGGLLFILISGICATLGSRSFRRGLVVFGCGMLITAVTYGMIALNMADADIAIHFGILHLLGTCMMLYPLLKKLPTPALAVLGGIILVVGYFVKQHTFPVEGLFIFGIRSPSYAAGDYYPLMPFLGWFLEGIVLGRTLYCTKHTLLPHFPADAAPVRFFRFCGRHSLLIYLAHQPICYGLVMLISLL